MKKIIICLIMALLVVGCADAQRKTRKKTSGKARTTATTQQPSIYGYAAKWKDKAEAGDAEAQTFLGDCFCSATNYTEAVKWYRKAAEQDYPHAVWKLAECYENGSGVEKNTTTAKSLYNKAHKLALPLANSGNASAQYVMGYLCEYGDGGVTQDKVEAVKWYRKAAELGYPAAQCNLAICYDYGEGVSQDKVEAVKWYRKAAEQGYPKAQYNLGYCYQHGEGVSQDKVEAVKWYRKAAELGHSKAQNNLGYCYQHGEGVTRNKSKAIEWYRKAAERGNKKAQENLDALRKNNSKSTKKQSSTKKRNNESNNQA